MRKAKTNKKDINNPHDKFFKVAFSMKIIVIDYFRNIFPKNWTEKLNLNSLKLETVSYISNDLKSYYSDIIWQCDLVNESEKVQIAFLFEHKSFIPEYPHLQILDYKRGGYNTQLAEGQKLKLIIPIIVYHGPKKWELKPFKNYFGEIPVEFNRFIDPFEYYLTNLSDYTDDMIKAFNAIFLVKTLLALKHFAEGYYIKKHFVELLLTGYEDNNSKDELDFIQFFSVYLSVISDEITDEEINEQAKEYDNHKITNKMDYISRILEKGRTEGKIEGKIEGEKLAIYKAYKRGGDVKLLSTLFDLPAKQILEIIEEMKKKELETNN